MHLFVQMERVRDILFMKKLSGPEGKRKEERKILKISYFFQKKLLVWSVADDFILINEMKKAIFCQ